MKYKIPFLSNPASGGVLAILLPTILVFLGTSGVVRAEESGSPWVKLREGPTLSNAPGESDQPLALASADFDEDGVPDLITSSASAQGGQVSVRRGNVDAIYPNSSEAKTRRQQGQFTEAAFLPGGGTFPLPEAADLIGTGDFDADGHWDVVTAHVGGSKLYWLRGDGRGNFEKAKTIELGGAVTALVTGEINRADGLTDVSVGIVMQDGARVLVFESPEGAMRGAPESFSLPAPASALAVGQLDREASNDIAIAAGNEVIIVHGRDRKLSQDATKQAEVRAAEMTRTMFDSAVTSIAIGDFAGDARQELAVLTSDGNVRVLGQETTASGASENGLQVNDGMTLQAASDSAGGTTPGRLLAAKVSALPKDDLLLFGGTNAVQIVTTREADLLDDAGKLSKPGSERMSIAASLAAESEVTAVLPMRLNADALKDLVLLNRNSDAPMVMVTQAAATFVVNATGNTSDKARGDGVCEDSAGNCTFSAAIQESNANPGADTINFNIPGPGIHTVSPSTPVTGVVTIDGTTQPGSRVEISCGDFQDLLFYGGNSVLRGVAAYRPVGGGAIILASSGNVIEGNYVGIRADGTRLAGDLTNKNGITFRGEFGTGSNNLIGGTTAQARNVISNCATAVYMDGGSSGNTIRGNYIGTNVAGTAALSNKDQAIRDTQANGLTIGGTEPGAGNVISGNTDQGRGTISIENATAALVQGNFIGTTADGMQPLSNSGAGIAVGGAAGPVTIGGTTPAARNVISANATGIFLNPHAAGGSELVQGNFIGTNASGTGALPNLGPGVRMAGNNETLGGTASGAGNLISGNGGDGVLISPEFENRVQGNFIGTDVTGTVAIPNFSDGVEIQSNGFNGARNNLIGGTSPAARNVISGNRENGIRYNSGGDAGPNRAEGNYIGVNRFGTGALGNGQHGVFLQGTPNNVGGSAPGAGNLIAFNGGDGIASGGGNFYGAILSNSIFSNAGLGIDRGNNGVNPYQANEFGQAPVITAVDSSDSETTITGKLRTRTDGGNLPQIIQFFSSSSPDPSGYGEGQTFLGQTTITAGSNAAVPFSATITPAVPPGRFISAVAVGQADTNNPNSIYSSEFSFCARVAGDATPANTPLRLNVIAPMVGGDTGVVTTTIIGEGIREGATVLLRRAGQADIIGVVRSISPDGSAAEVSFDLTGRARGGWDVVVTNSDGASSSLNNTFTIEEGRAAEVWADIIGPGILRVGRSHLFYVAFGNTGNVDAPATEFRMTLPRGLFTIAELPHSLDGSPAVVIDDGELIILQFFVRNVPNGSSNAIPLRLLPREERENFKFELTALTSVELGAAANVPIDPSASASLELSEDTPSLVRFTMHITKSTGNIDIPFQMTRAETTQEQEPTITITENNGIVTVKYEGTVPLQNGSALSAERARRSGDSPPQPHADPTPVQVVSVLAQIPAAPGIPNPFNAASGLISTNNAANAASENNSINEYLIDNDLIDPDSPQAVTLQNTGGSAPVILNAVSTLAGAPGSPVNAVTGGQLQALTGVMDGAHSLQLWSLYRSDLDFQIKIDELANNPVSGTLTREQIKQLLTEEALKTKNNKPNSQPRSSRQSRDPNDKYGPQGPGAARFITGIDPMNYLIVFENQPSATLAAQDVVITDQLDVTKFDLATFELGPINFGKDVLVTPPPGLSQWSTDIDLRPGQNLVVRVIAALEKTTGVATWRFFSLDPITLQPTEDAEAGFLPPNKNAPEGEGGVMFTIELKPGLAAGTEIRNKARIVFDTNAPIDTPEFLNTIDNSRPTSEVEALPATNASSLFEVRWSGSDTGAGIASYTIYVSENGGAYTIWVANTTVTSAFYQGRPNANYSFYSVAEDGAGNIEAPPGPADASTTTLSGQLLNIATRLRVQTGENVLIGGLIVTGTDPKKVIIRGIGPSLSGVFAGALANPTLELYQGNTLLASNDNWKDSQRTEIEATTIPPTNDLESAIVRTLSPGNYTAIMSGKDGGTGIGVVEAYDLDQAANSKLANIATRGFVDSGDNVMIGGVIAGGNGGADTRVLIRAIGPSLANFGIGGALQDPTLELRNANGALVRENDNWQADQQGEIEATTIPPSNAAESAIVATLTPGNYTAIVRGKNNTTGVGLVEVYNVQ